MVTWDSVADAETLSITVSRDGQSIHEAAVPASTTSWSRDGVIGGEYSVVVTASIGVLTGRSSRCSTSVARAEELFRRGDCNDDEVIDLADRSRRCSSSSSRLWMIPLACEHATVTTTIC